MESVEDQGPIGDEIDNLHAISLHALVGTEGHQTIRIEGRIKNQSVLVLIDSGSSHNFINQKVAKRLACAIQTITGLQISVANGELLKTQEMCKGVLLELQGCRQGVDLLVLPLKGCDVVLGIQWLKTLGSIVWDFNSLLI